ncbi:hypothetical protein BGZ76_000289 [Entomortierella beljakovae]|nr:hypothetical protein BGZ76_000289 [Entomortierella beljakovae]
MDADMATCLCSNSINTLFHAPFTISIPTYSSYSIVTTIAPSSTTSASTTTSTSTTTSSSTGADPNGTSNPNPVINGDPSSSEINNSDKALTIGLGASLGAVVFFIMGTASAFFYFRKKNKHRNSASTNLATASNPTPA